MRSGGREGHEEDGDVVAASAFVRCVDERFTGEVESVDGGGDGDGGEEVGDLFVGEFAGEAVGGEKVEVVGEGAEALDVGLNGGLGAYGTGDEVAHGGAGGFFSGDLSGAELFFDEGVILGEEGKLAAAAAVTAAIAYVGEPKGGGIGGAGVGVRMKGLDFGDGGGGDGWRGRLRRGGGLSLQDGGVEEAYEGGSHSGEARGFARVLIDGIVGGIDGGGEASVGSRGWDVFERGE